jgi:hypothetical protein
MIDQRIKGWRCKGVGQRITEVKYKHHSTDMHTTALCPGNGCIRSTFLPQTVVSLCRPQFSGGMHCAADVEFAAAVAQRSSRRMEFMLLG